MAGSYYEKEKSYSQSNGTSVSTSYKEKQILRPEDLNQLGDDAVQGFFYGLNSVISNDVIDFRESMQPQKWGCFINSSPPLYAKNRPEAASLD